MAVWNAGGEPLVVHPVADVLVERRFGFAHGVLLPGGGDLSPRWSGQDDHESLYDVDLTQDTFDLELARWALSGGPPLLAICRGAQVVNVALGGTLIQDLAETTGSDHRHLIQDIAIGDDSPLGPIVHTDSLTISCYHHQALGQLGEGLTPAAHAGDGTIEAITRPGHTSWFLGVQWHPEDSAAANPDQQRIFSALVDAARDVPSHAPR